MTRWLILVVVFIIGLSIFIVSTVKAENYLPLLGKVIVIDPGHGGRDPGTMYGNIYEKDINLEISKKLEKTLMEQGAIVYMIRESDVDLSSKYDKQKKRGDLYRRILFIEDEKKKTDIYLSIHINWYKNSSWSGAEVLYHNINPNNKLLGEIVMKHLKKDFDTKRSLKKTSLYLYRNTTVPGVLIECGFLSNPNERYLLRQESYQEKLSGSITDAVIEYFQALSSSASG
ncbi:MAG: N-acetylmuramoyl-L-alanine amidase [Bacilli bacterium]|nr:N-acetylmuramoyl-L-alanine amidase [Bacilli bacterium]